MKVECEGAGIKDTWTIKPGQNISDKTYPDKTYRTKGTGQNIPDNIYRTKYTRQNIPDKIYRTKYTLTIADQLHVRMPEIATCCCDGIDDRRKELFLYFWHKL